MILIVRFWYTFLNINHILSPSSENSKLWLKNNVENPSRFSGHMVVVNMIHMNPQSLATNRASRGSSPLGILHIIMDLLKERTRPS